ncbi:MAG: HAMP domain-containing protein [Clostridiales bacterium]|nr:HAMP domain-containing protein [Clostridiales bacterium]
MNKNSLLYRLITTFTTILAMILVVSSILLTLAVKSKYSKERISEFQRQSDIISDSVISCLYDQKEYSYENLQNTLNFVSNSLGVEVIVTDNSGFVYASSNAKKEKPSLTKLELSDENMDKLKNNEIVENGYVGEGDNKRDAYLRPIFRENAFCGMIVLETKAEVIDSSLAADFKMIWIYTLGVVIVLVVSINYALKKKLITPLNEINTVANRLSKGEVDQRIEIDSDDEIGELARSFNIMASSLEAVDSNRRDFISNVSHELRSPITSMKGFISGILDGVVPKDKESYYLKLVYDEINRLSRLINDLLDISSMEVGKFKLTIMEVDINALVKRCLLNMESKIKANGVHVNVTLEGEHLFVYADSDRIMQVITNLVDNAIKYGGENGNIIINTNIKGNKVYVSVYNNGPKMTEEELSHIWDRFYKSDKSRTIKESTGLGLSIVRLILTQHKEDIWVNNERDGVMFTFTLARV